MNIRQAKNTDLDQLSILFAQYREFYGQPYEPGKAKQFLEERLNREESKLFIAIENGEQTGFTQLYPSFSSVSMTKIWILNDLFVSGNHRQNGIGQLLINQVSEYCKTTGRKKIALSTAYDNFIHKNCTKNWGLKGKISTITNYRWHKSLSSKINYSYEFCSLHQ